MRYLTILTSLLLINTLPAEEQSATIPPVKVSPQSVECFYPADETDAVLCTIRLHLTPPQGHYIRIRASEATPQLPLIAHDAKGNELHGSFSEWEICFDDYESNCVIAVYNFKARPQGGHMVVDSQVDIPVTGGRTEHEPQIIPTAEPTSVTVNGHVFKITPAESGAEDPDHTVLLIEYANNADIAEIVLNAEDGTPLPTTIVDGYYNPENKLSQATYVIQHKAEKLQFILRTYANCGRSTSPVRFRATIGR